MRTAGIICEYNPFHWGHQHQIEKTRTLLGQDTAIVCLMSGNYVQRGEPAIYPKSLRAKAAIYGGADLILELPITTAVNAAGYFAAGAVTYLHRLGCVDYVSFGSECGDLSALQVVADRLDSPDFESALQQQLKTGASYAAARTLALGEEGTLLKSPNNALGVEYLRALRRLNSSITPVTIPRNIALASATKIREDLTLHSLPFDHLYQNAPVHRLCHGERAMLAVLRCLPEDAFSHMAFEAEGLWSKVMKACRQENRLEDIILSCKSKRYAYSRLRRTLLCLFLGLDREKMQMTSPYLRVLAANDRGRQIIRQASVALPLVSGAIPKTADARCYFELECRASDLYTLFAPPDIRESWGQEKSHRPMISK